MTDDIRVGARYVADKIAQHMRIELHGDDPLPYTEDGIATAVDALKRGLEKELDLGVVDDFWVDAREPSEYEMKERRLPVSFGFKRGGIWYEFE